MQKYRDMLSGTLFDKPILSKKDVATIMGWSSSTTRRKFAKRVVPYRIVDGKIVVIRAEFVEWIDQGD